MKKPKQVRNKTARNFEEKIAKIKYPNE